MSQQDFIKNEQFTRPKEVKTENLQKNQSNKSTKLKLYRPPKSSPYIRVKLGSNTIFMEEKISREVSLAGKYFVKLFIDHGLLNANVVDRSLPGFSKKFIAPVFAEKALSPQTFNNLLSTQTENFARIIHLLPMQELIEFSTYMVIIADHMGLMGGRFWSFLGNVVSGIVIGACAVASFGTSAVVTAAIVGGILGAVRGGVSWYYENKFEKAKKKLIEKAEKIEDDMDRFEKNPNHTKVLAALSDLKKLADDLEHAFRDLISDYTGKNTGSTGLSVGCGSGGLSAMPAGDLMSLFNCKYEASEGDINEARQSVKRAYDRVKKTQAIVIENCEAKAKEEFEKLESEIGKRTTEISKVADKGLNRALIEGFSMAIFDRKFSEKLSPMQDLISNFEKLKTSPSIYNADPKIGKVENQEKIDEKLKELRECLKKEFVKRDMLEEISVDDDARDIYQGIYFENDLNSIAMKTALFEVVLKNRPNLIRYLCFIRGAQVNVFRDMRPKNSLLQASIISNSIKTASVLLELGANKLYNNTQGQTALDIAIELENQEAITLLH